MSYASTRSGDTSVHSTSIHSNAQTPFLPIIDLLATSYYIGYLVIGYWLCYFCWLFLLWNWILLLFIVKFVVGNITFCHFVNIFVIFVNTWEMAHFLLFSEKNRNNNKKQTTNVICFCCEKQEQITHDNCCFCLSKMLFFVFVVKNKTNQQLC